MSGNLFDFVDDCTYELDRLHEAGKLQDAVNSGEVGLDQLSTWYHYSEYDAGPEYLRVFLEEMSSGEIEGWVLYKLLGSVPSLRDLLAEFPAISEEVYLHD